MPSSLGYAAIVLLLAAGALAPSGASAQERCSGTFCDLYYGNANSTLDQPAAKPAAPTPLTAPSGGILGFFSSGGGAPGTAPGTATPPATRPVVGVGGGGVAAMARGEPPERCTGTFCDLFYGGAPAQTPAESATAGLQGIPASPRSQQPAPTTAVAAEPPPEAADPDLAPEPTQPRRAAAARPDCVATAQDPWRCYR